MLTLEDSWKFITSKQIKYSSIGLFFGIIIHPMPFIHLNFDIISLKYLTFLFLYALSITLLYLNLVYVGSAVFFKSKGTTQDVRRYLLRNKIDWISSERSKY